MTMTMKKLAIIPVVLSLVAGVLLWPFGGEEALAAMTLRAEDTGGRVEILRPSEKAIVVGSDDVAVQPGDVIRTYNGGLAQVALEGERVAWVGGRKQQAAGVPEAQMGIVSTTMVETGSGTVMAEAGDPMKVRFGDAVASGSDGVFRVDRLAGFARAASYKGTVRVSAPGETDVVLDRLYQAQATASDLRPAQPYRLDPGDPFDGRELSSVLELENKLGVISQGFANELGNQKPTLGYFRAFAGDKNIEEIKRYLRRPAIDLLLGFTIAMNTKAYGFGDALDTAFENRDNGGSWGVVAAIVRSDPRLLVADLNNIIDASRIVAVGDSGPVFDAAAGQDASLGNVAPAPGGGGSDAIVAPPPGGGGGDGSGGDGSGGDGGEEEPAEDPEEAEDCNSNIECTVNDAGDQLPGGGGGGGGDPEPDPSPSGLLDGVQPKP